MYKVVAGLLIFLSLVIAYSSFFRGDSLQLASIFFHDSVTADSLREAYDDAEKSSKRNPGEKVKILIVPGHDRQYSGTVYRGLQEVELTTDLGEKLYTLLQREPAFDVHLTQTKQGYTSEFSNYFDQNKQAIQEFIETQKGLMNQYVESGQVERVIRVSHNAAPGEMATRLYGINKWANDNGVDIVVHIHFNDYPGRKKNVAGEYSGFSIYVPENQYSNAPGSKSVAEYIFNRLDNFYPSSDLPKENLGIVEDQELIALGSHNSLDAASMLIEYGYIYEPGVFDLALRDKILEDLALQTYLGVMDFFGETAYENGRFGSRLLPHEWQEDLQNGDGSKLSVLSLQAALVSEGVYPPPGETKNSCPISGRFGPCTEKSVKIFQEKYGILPAQGFVGELTRAKLNELY